MCASASRATGHFAFTMRTVWTCCVASARSSCRSARCRMSAYRKTCTGYISAAAIPSSTRSGWSANAAMRASIRATVERGLPCVAECGGFMYLTQSIAGHAMAGVLSGSCFDAGKLTRFGYATLTAQRDSMLLCRAGEQIPAHEFHRWDADKSGRGLPRRKSPAEEAGAARMRRETLYAGYPHFHFYANPSALRCALLNACRKEKHRYE